MAGRSRKGAGYCPICPREFNWQGRRDYHILKFLSVANFSPRGDGCDFRQFHLEQKCV
jgi:hypothetical protein